MGWLSLLGSLAGTVYNAFTTERHRKEDKQFAHNEAELASQRQMEMQNKLLAYNDPSAQMSRMQGAGLNPDLMYGQMSSQVPVAGTGNQASTPSTPVQYVDPALLSQIKLNSAQEDLLNAQAQEVRDRNERENEKQPQVLESMQATINNLNQDLKVKQAQIEELGLKGELEKAQALKIDFDKAMADKDYILRRDKTLQDIKESKSRILSETKNRQLTDTLINLNKRTYDEMLATWTYRAFGLDLQNKALQQELQIGEESIKQARLLSQELGIKVDADGFYLEKAKAKASRHTVVGRYLDDAFGSIGQLLGGSASYNFSTSQTSKVTKLLK